jgi:NTE family protein
MTSRALVLGGGGVAGIAWETGVLAGLSRAGVDVAGADLFIGTSAGSVVGAQLASNAPVEDLLAAQLAPPADSLERVRPYSQAAVDEQNRKLVDKVVGDVAEARRRIGAFARRSETVPPEARRAIIAARLPGTQWPARALKLVAVDAETGEGQVFDRAGGADFVDAVAASCAVPGAWPVVHISGRSYMDGGIRSMTNADLASGAARVLVLAPLGYSEGNPVSGHLHAEVDALCQAGTQVLVVVPDEASLSAMGENVLDPARRPGSAEAGLTQGQLLAAAAQAFWTF